MTELKTIDKENFWDIIELAGTPQQEKAGYCAPNSVSIAQAKVQPELKPLAIYHDDTPVGFVMYCIDEDDGEWWLYRLMTDHRYQGKGHARRAMEMVLADVKKDPTRHKMYLGVDPESASAVALYKSLGFAFDGRVYGKEHIMVLQW